MSVRKNSIIRGFICVLSVLLFFTLLLPYTASAENNNSISLVCRQESDAVENMRWRIYKVGEKKNGIFHLTGIYKDYPINLRDMSADNIAGAAKAMESFVIGSGADYLAESYTDAKGTVSFPKLETGLYFAVAKGVPDGQLMRRAEPIFFEVTDTGMESQIFPKVYTTGTLADEISNLYVKKVWDDDNNAYLSRPDSVTVDIYKDGDYAETVTLNEANNWKYNWLTDDHEAEWRVVERYIPKKYEVHIDYNLTQYLIKNTYVPELVTDGDYYYITTGQPLTTTSTTTTTAVTETTTSEITASTSSSSSVEGGTATKSETTTSTTTDVAGGTGVNSSVSSTVTTTADVSSTGKSKLPQTGQLWWPVPILLGGGFMFIIIAVFVKPKKNKKDQ